MKNESRLKSTQKWMAAVTAALIVMIIAARVFYGSLGMAWILGAVLLVMGAIHFVVLVVTRNPAYIFLVLFYILAGLTIFPSFSEAPWHLAAAIGAAAALMGMIGVFISKTINWRYREVLELAAAPVEEVEDGFTPRPFPSGSFNYSRSESEGLGRFLRKYVIAYPFFEKNRVVYVIPRYMWSYLLQIRKNYNKETYVAFADDGEVTVRIDQRDYQAYKEELSFDQLCTFMGNLFKQFMQDYKQGKEKQILHRLNAAGRGVTNEGRRNV